MTSLIGYLLIFFGIIIIVFNYKVIYDGIVKNETHSFNHIIGGLSVFLGLLFINNSSFSYLYLLAFPLDCSYFVLIRSIIYYFNQKKVKEKYKNSNVILKLEQKILYATQLHAPISIYDRFFQIKIHIHEIKRYHSSTYSKLNINPLQYRTDLCSTLEPFYSLSEDEINLLNETNIVLQFCNSFLPIAKLTIQYSNGFEVNVTVTLIQMYAIRIEYDNDCIYEFEDNYLDLPYELINIKILDFKEEI